MVEMRVEVEVNEGDGERARLSIGKHAYMLAQPPLLPAGR
jgi:hypothetical protein